MPKLIHPSKKGYLLRYIFFSIFLSLTLLTLISLSLRLSAKKDANESNSEPIDTPHISFPLVIIDAGHGGEDGGAIGKNGIYEKDLNLLIATDLKDMLSAEGIDTIMTRETDIMLYDKNSDYKGRKKMLDLNARLKIAESYENCIFVSIHMNSFPEEKYSGLQVYYSPNHQSSVLLAESIQKNVSKYLQSENSRSVKKAGSNIYLLDRIQSPAVLIECGFISNYEECELLSSKEYRQKLTLLIFCGICEYISQYSS